MATSWLNKVHWTDEGLVPVVVQERGSDRVLMLAWMNREALQRTADTNEAHYWSRSRKKLWHKGEESGHLQRVHEIRLDCDSDVLLLTVEQEGGIACHTGRVSCFFQQLKNGEWVAVEPVLRPPEVIYGKK
jgi:phosphoribosyl-AMP cyclohydrolase